MTGFDELWPGGPRFRQVEGSFRLSTDSVLLADFAREVRGKKILDLGCGAGVLTVLLQTQRPEATVHGIDIQESSARLCRENMRENGFDNSGICCADLREHRSLFAAGAYDLVVSNPPYFPERSGFCAPDEARATARDERCCSLEDLSRAARYLCRWGGSFVLVHRPERLSEICCCLSGQGLEPKRLRFVQHRPGAAPNLLLLEARRGGKAGMKILPPLLLTDSEGRDSDEVKRIYHLP